MGNFFDKDIDFYTHSLLNKDQLAVSEFFAKFLQDALSAGTFAGAEGLFEKSFLAPALEGFESFTRPAIAGQFANAGASLSSRRSKTQAEALTRTQLGAQQQFAQLLPAFMQREIGLVNAALGFSTRQTQVTTGVAQPGLGEQIASGIELGGQIYGSIFGGVPGG